MTMLGRLVRYAIVAALAGFAMASMASPASAAWATRNCDPGSYLTGFDVRGGVWIDRINPICARWNRFGGQLETGYASNLPPLAWSHGGHPFPPTQCPSGTAVWGIRFDLPSNQGIRVAENVTLTCRTLDPAHTIIKNAAKTPTSGSGRSDNDQDYATDFPVPSFCHDDEIAIGFEANVDQFVGEIAVHCGKYPTKFSIPTSPSAPGGIPSGPIGAPPPPPPLNLQAGDSSPVGVNTALRQLAACPANTALAALRGTTRNGVDSVSPICAPLVAGGPGTPGLYGQLGSNIPGSGATYTICDPGNWVVGIRAIVSNAPNATIPERIIGFVAVCANGANAPQWAGHKNPPFGMPVTSTGAGCGPGKIANGIYGWTDNQGLISGFGLRCTDAPAAGGGGGGGGGPVGSGFAGNWTVTLKDGYVFPMTLNQSGSAVSGSYDPGKRNGTISNGVVSGTALNFNWVQTGTIKGSGTGYFYLLDAHHMSGGWTFGPFSGTWSAVR
jgi:hypothetical protein